MNEGNAFNLSLIHAEPSHKISIALMRSGFDYREVSHDLIDVATTLALRLGLSVDASYDMISNYDPVLLLSRIGSIYCTLLLYRQGSVSPGYRGLVVLEYLMKPSRG